MNTTKRQAHAAHEAFAKEKGKKEGKKKRKERRKVTSGKTLFDASDKARQRGEGKPVAFHFFEDRRTRVYQTARRILSRYGKEF